MKRGIIIRSAIILIFSFYAFSCKKPDVEEDTALIASLLANSLDTIKIGTNRYFLESDLSRDFMPSYQHKRPLVALIFLVNVDSLPINPNINISKLYVIKDQLVWTSIPFDSNQPQVPDYKLDKVRNDGPEWDVNIFVDVVAEVVDKSTNDKFLIIARQQKIQRLD